MPWPSMKAIISSLRPARSSETGDIRGTLVNQALYDFFWLFVLGRWSLAVPRWESRSWRFLWVGQRLKTNAQPPQLLWYTSASTLKHHVFVEKKIGLSWP